MRTDQIRFAYEVQLLDFLPTARIAEVPLRQHCQAVAGAGHHGAFTSGDRRRRTG